MILVFILAILLLLTFLLVFSTFRIQVKELVIANHPNKSKIVENYSIGLGLYLFNKIRLIYLPINKEKVEKMPPEKLQKMKKKIKRIETEELRSGKIKKEQVKELIKKLKARVTYFDLKTQLGTQDVMITTALVAILSATIGIFLAHVIEKFDRKKYFYEIQPIYQNRNTINLRLKCIICIKMVHIIHIILILFKIRRVEKNERTSNRGAYDYSYE